jgi:signal transduction histidine kinase
MPDPSGAPPASAAEAKAFTAEQSTSWLRLAVIVFGVVVYWTLWHPQGRPDLAATISAVALAYGIYDVVGKPYLRFPALQTAAWTAITDATLIVLWLHATGDAASPFFPLWYISLVAVAFRYDWWATLLATGLYIVLYVGLAAWTGGLAAYGTEILLRCGYLLLLGALGAVLAHATSRLFEERAALARSIVETEAQRKAAEAAAELHRLQELDRFKTEFIGSAAHELNTPLTPLVLQTHMLRRAGERDPEVARVAAVLERNIGRLTNLVQDMLDVARLQSGRLRLETSDADLAPVVGDTLESFKEAARSKGVRLESRLEHPLQVHADRRRIAQVLDNLVSNAIKFSDPGGQVVVEARVEDGAAVFHVRDQGLGFTADQARRLFHPFSRLHAAEDGRPGTGLGLYICRGIVQAHGGEITCDSPGPRQGATFTVRLPAQRPGGDGPAPGVAPPQD